MVKITYKGKRYDVARGDCAGRPCFHPGEDKGTFTQGRGYTSYYEKPRLVCMTRHLHGCPHASVCPKCHTLELDPPGAACHWVNCDGVTVEWEKTDDQR